MSGFEIVGLLLGILPICIQVMKNEETPIHCIWEATSKNKTEQAMRVFYEEFHHHTFMLKEHLESIVRNLPLDQNLRNKLLRTMESSDDADFWLAETKIREAFIELFGESKFHYIVEILKKVLNLFGRLLQDKTHKLSKDDKSQAKIFQRLKEFQKKSRHGGLIERLKFFLGVKNRNAILANLERWNGRLEQIITKVCDDSERGGRRSNVTTPSVTSSNANLHSTTQLRALSKRLFTTLSKSWKCDCPTQHLAKFCLSTCSTAVSTKESLFAQDCPTGISFDFLLQLLVPSDPSRWFQGTVQLNSVTSGMGSTPDSVRELRRICDDIKSRQPKHMGLMIVVEDDGSPSQFAWTRPLVPKRSPGKATSAISFDLCLRNFPSPSLLERRKLALTFAYSLLQLHESPWLSSQWDKEHIHFFTTEISPTLKEHFDMERPYLSTSFASFPTDAELDLRPVLWHRNAGVLKLGLLLIEIHMWKPIEDLRTDLDYTDPKDHVYEMDLNTAFRLLNEAFIGDKDAGYRELVEHCLQVPWVTGTFSAVNAKVGAKGRQEEVIWEGVYNDVIVPLENEIGMGSVGSI